MLFKGDKNEITNNDIHLNQHRCLDAIIAGLLITIRINVQRQRNPAIVWYVTSVIRKDIIRS
jgi:hypothetical protein